MRVSAQEPDKIRRSCRSDLDHEIRNGSGQWANVFWRDSRGVGEQDPGMGPSLLGPPGQKIRYGGEIISHPRATFGRASGQNLLVVCFPQLSPFPPRQVLHIQARVELAEGAHDGDRNMRIQQQLHSLPLSPLRARAFMPAIPAIFRFGKRRLQFLERSAVFGSMLLESLDFLRVSLTVLQGGMHLFR